MAALVLRYSTIVPAAHYRAFDIPYQQRLYALFHTTNACRIAHAICTPIALWFMLVAAWHVELPVGALFGADELGPRLSLPLAALFAAYAFSHDRLVGAVLVPLHATAWMTASLFARDHGPESLPLALAGLWAASALQTASHFFEPVPPPLSGCEQFLPFARFWRTSSVGRKGLAFVLANSVYVLLELVAAPRVLPCQVLRILQWFGYAGPSRAETEREAARMRESWHEIWSE
jgi:hypothetical protein